MAIDLIKLSSDGVEQLGVQVFYKILDTFNAVLREAPASESRMAYPIQRTALLSPTFS